MARTVDYLKKAEKIKELVDELANELVTIRTAPVAAKKSLKISEIDLENEDVRTLQLLQARIARIIVEKSK